MSPETTSVADRNVTSILVLTGDPSLPDPTKPGHHYNPEDLDAFQRMRAALCSLESYRFEFFSDHERLLERLRGDLPDLVLNFCDTGFRNLAAQELHIPALLELRGVPYSGAPPAGMAIAFDKQIVRLLADTLGIPTPCETFLAADVPASALPDLWPALIKPNRADGSLGITKDAVVRSAAEAADYISWVRTELPGRALLVQEYLPGPEYGVGMIGNPGRDLRPLPVLEVDFSGLPAGLEPILSYESKTIPESPYWRDIRFVEARTGPAHRALMLGASERLFARLGLRDYARLDFRCARDGTPRLMEVNPNPAWGWDGKLALMAGFEGIPYPRMLAMIIEAALARTGLGRSTLQQP